MFIRTDESGFVQLSKQMIEVMSAKMIMVIAYLRIYMSISGTVSLSIEFLARRLGFKPDSHAGRINEKLYSILSDLMRAEAIDFYLPEKKYRQCFLITINPEHEYFKATGNFVVLEEEELVEISKAEKYQSDILTAVLLQIKKRITKPKKTRSKEENDLAANYCFASVETITSDLAKMQDMKISTETTRRYIQQLINMELLSEHKTGQYEYNGQLRAMMNFYNDGSFINHIACDHFAKDYLRKMKGIVVDSFIPLGNTKYDSEDIFSEVDEEQNAVIWSIEN